MTEDEVFLAMERDSRAKTERVRQILIEQGRPDLVADLDIKMRDITLGIAGARSTWGALSAAQRHVMDTMGEGMYLRRASGSRTRYDAIGFAFADQDSAFNICGLPTARNLSSRELVMVAGGAFDPEAKFVLTERGQFVLQHGPAQP